MAVQSIINANFDMQKPLQMVTLRNDLFSEDQQGDVFRVSITDGGNPVDLSGMGVSGYFVRADNATVALTGSVSSNIATIALTSACYAKPGRCSFVMRVSISGTVHAVYAAVGSVRRSSTDAIVDDSNVIPSLSELLAQIDATQQAATAANNAAQAAQDAAEDITNLQVNASTLPTGSEATASYADGVLTLGLPRGEKGDTGSASPIKVNGVEGVDDNITLTGDDVPLSAADNIALSAAVVKRDRVANLLDNSDFTNPVNQRGWESSSQVAANGHFIDRWRSASAQSPTITKNGITASQEIYQLLDKSNLVGKSVTAAVGLSDGTVIAKSGVVPSDAEWVNFINTAVDGVQLLVANVNASIIRFRVTPSGKTVRWAALYEGTYTADTLPAYQPKGYAAELMECMRYFRKIQGAVSITGLCTSSGANMTLPLAVPMRVTPTLTATNYGTVRAGGKSFTPTGASVHSSYNSHVIISLTAESTGVSNYVGIWASAAFTLDAELQS